MGSRRLKTSIMPLLGLLGAMCLVLAPVGVPQATAAVYYNETSVNLDCSGRTVNFVVTSRNPFDRPAAFEAELFGPTRQTTAARRVSLGPPKQSLSVPAGGQVTMVFADAPEAFPSGSVESTWSIDGYNAGAAKFFNFQASNCPAYNRAHLPFGRIVMSVVDGRNYALLGYAIDPETGGPVRMRVDIPLLRFSREFDWNHRWADMPRSTGVNRTESLLFLTQLPPGEHTVCLDALDPQGAEWNRLDCRTHLVK